MPADSGAYTAVARNSFGSVTSQVATVTVAAPPTLSIHRLDPNRLEVRWPLSFTGYSLRSASSLNTPSPWLPVLEPDVPDATSHRVTVDATIGARFFRLRKP